MNIVPLVAVAALARLPLAAFGIAVLVHVERLTGSFAVAGAVTGVLALAQGVGGPLLGRLVDARGQTGVLLASGAVASAALAALAVLPVGSPPAAFVGLAVVVGAANPPVGACVRALLAMVVPAGAGLRRAYAADATTTELTWVSAPPLVMVAVTLWDSRVALLAVAAVLLVATLRFAALPTSRAWRPVPPTPATTGRGVALRSPGLRTLVAALVGVGVLFGATEVAVTAAAAGLGQGAAAGALLGAWGVGSFVGGVAATRWGTARSAPGLAGLLAALGVGHLLLAPAAGHVLALGVVIALAGSMIAPILAAAYAMVDAVAPTGTATEAFAWIATASAVGTSGGAALAGVVADAASPAAAFLVAGGAAVLAAALVVARRHTLPATEPLATAVPAAA
jgi:MFS family permease